MAVVWAVATDMAVSFAISRSRISPIFNEFYPSGTAIHLGEGRLFELLAACCMACFTNSPLGVDRNPKT